MEGFNESIHNTTSDEQLTSHPSDAPFTTCKLINVVVSISRNMNAARIAPVEANETFSLVGGLSLVQSVITQRDLTCSRYELCIHVFWSRLRESRFLLFEI